MLLLKCRKNSSWHASLQAIGEARQRKGGCLRVSRSWHMQIMAVEARQHDTAIDRLAVEEIAVQGKLRMVEIYREAP